MIWKVWSWKFSYEWISDDVEIGFVFKYYNSQDFKDLTPMDIISYAHKELPPVIKAN